MISKEAKERYKANRKVCANEQVAFINETFKLGKPCADCGNSFHPCAMDFHHRSASSKIEAVSKMLGRRRTATIIIEIEKCDLLCAVCHRIRHHKWE